MRLLNGKDIARYFIVLILASDVLVGSVSAALVFGARQAGGTQPPQKASHAAASRQTTTPKPDKNATSKGSSPQNGEKKAGNKIGARKREEPSDNQAGVRKVNPPGDRGEGKGNGEAAKRGSKTGRKPIKPKSPTSGP